jgi:putative transposase
MANTFTNLITHVVFSTKYREPLIHNYFKKRLYEYFGGIIHNKQGRLLSAGGTSDHVHLLVKLLPVESVSQAVGELKGYSSKWINDQKLIDGHFSWQAGFGAFSVSESQIPIIRKYILTQKEHHKDCSFKEEFTGMLENLNLSYDSGEIQV